MPRPGMLHGPTAVAGPIGALQTFRIQHSCVVDTFHARADKRRPSDDPPALRLLDTRRLGNLIFLLPSPNRGRPSCWTRRRLPIAGRGPSGVRVWPRFPTGSWDAP